MKYQFVRCNKDLPKVHKMSRRYRVMMMKRAAKYRAKDGGRGYGKR